MVTEQLSKCQLFYDFQYVVNSSLSAAHFQIFIDLVIVNTGGNVIGSSSDSCTVVLVAFWFYSRLYKCNINCCRNMYQRILFRVK